MTDTRQLLEDAARAANLEWFRHTDGGLWLKTGGIWDPLTDDGDALRLAVKAGISLRMHTGGCMATDGYLIDAYESYGDDPGASARRAVTRAAAAIGERMRLTGEG